MTHGIACAVIHVSSNFASSTPGTLSALTLSLGVLQSQSRLPGVAQQEVDEQWVPELPPHQAASAIRHYGGEALLLREDDDSQLPELKRVRVHLLKPLEQHQHAVLCSHHRGWPCWTLHPLSTMSESTCQWALPEERSTSYHPRQAIAWGVVEPVCCWSQCCRYHYRKASLRKRTSKLLIYNQMKRRQ